MCLLCCSFLIINVKIKKACGWRYCTCPITPVSSKVFIADQWIGYFNIFNWFSLHAVICGFLQKNKKIIFSNYNHDCIILVEHWRELLWFWHLSLQFEIQLILHPHKYIEFVLSISFLKFLFLFRIKSLVSTNFLQVNCLNELINKSINLIHSWLKSSNNLVTSNFFL